MSVLEKSRPLLTAQRRDHPAERTRGDPGPLEADVPQCFWGLRVWYSTSRADRTLAEDP